MHRNHRGLSSRLGQSIEWMMVERGGLGNSFIPGMLRSRSASLNRLSTLGLLLTASSASRQ